jgi:hypothetical protein
MKPRQRAMRSIVPLLALWACDAGEKDPASTLTCGPGTEEVDDVCVAIEVVDTEQVIDTEVPELERGYYERPMVWLQKQVGRGGAVGPGGEGQTHMHTSEMVYREGAADRPAEVFVCSYTFSVLRADDAQNMGYMAQGWLHYPDGYPVTPLTGTRAPGCINLTLDDDDPDIVYVTHHGNITDGDAFITGWDINSVASNPATPTNVTLSPVQLPMTMEGGGVSYEGLDYENGYLWVTLHDEGLGVYQRDPITNVISRVASYRGVLENAWEVRVVGDIAYVTDGSGGGLVTLDVSDPMNITDLGRVRFPGVAHDLAVDGTTAYVAAENGGLVIVDVTDPTAPTVLSTVEVPGSAIAVDYDDGRVYLGAWNDARVYDVADPSNPRIIGAARVEVHKAYSGDGGDRPNMTDRVLGIAGNGDFVYNGTWWTPNSFQVHADRVAPYLYLPENLNFLTFPGDLAEGEFATQEVTLRNDGNAPLTIYDMWADNPNFTVSPPQVRIEAGETAEISLAYTAGPGGVEERTLFHFASDDPAQPLRDAYLAGNLQGLSVGDPFPETTATLLASNSGSEWSSVDETGNVLLLGYWATF